MSLQRTRRVAKPLSARTIQPARWDREGLLEILSKFLGKRILVVGDVGIDRYTIGTVERVSPEAPVPIVRVEEERFKLGLAANVADNVQALGGEPWLVGVVGSDRAAADFRILLKKNRISASHLIVDRSRRTVLKERVVSDRQQLLRIDYENLHGIGSDVEKRIERKIAELMHEADGVVLEDYAKGMLSVKLARSVIRAAVRARKFVAVDPNAKSAMELYAGATVLTPNTKEAEKLTEIRILGLDTLKLAGSKLLRGTGARHVVITRGKDGMAIFSRGQSGVRLIPTYAREVYDVSGAGDTVIAVVALALAGGATIEDAVILGNLAAGVEVGKRGTATVSPDEIREAMKQVW